MSVSADSLHLLAHQAQRRARTDEDWWDNPLDTALAAVSATRHPPAYRNDGANAVERLRRWHRDGQPRRISADVAALTLAAAAAADLGDRDRDLEAAAIAAAEDLSGRTRTAAPPLHVTLTVWALDRLRLDRTAKPWPALRQHLARVSSGGGAEVPLETLARALSAASFDARALVQRLLADVPTSPTLEDGVVLLWILTIAIERSGPELDQDDSGLRALIDRRTRLAERLARELDADAFKAPEAVEFDPTDDLDARTPTFLSSMEALLLDISLASRDEEKPWLRYEEAADLFAQRERAAVALLARRTGLLLSAAGALAGGLLSVVLAFNDVVLLQAVLAGVALASTITAIAATIWHRHTRTKLSRALVTSFAALGFVAGLDLVNDLLKDPVLDDVGGVVAGVLLTAAITIVIAVADGNRTS